MIGYRISRPDLEARIRAFKPTWMDRAAERKELARKAGRFAEEKSIWSEVKPVYMELQGGSKCVFCERKLESPEYGAGEQAVEHFRPKGRVSGWSPSTSLVQAGVNVTPPPRAAKGYHLLAYDILNYTACCIPCNSALKGDRFPIEGVYDTDGEDPRTLLGSEKPLLVYPVGEVDDDPEDLIEFEGVSPRARVASGHRRHRALVTIEFFALDDAVARKNLMRERALILCVLFPQLEKVSSGTSAERRIADRIIKMCLSEKSPHANCARSFKRLFDADRVKARGLFERAAAFDESTS